MPEHMDYIGLWERERHHLRKARGAYELVFRSQEGLGACVLFEDCIDQYQLIVSFSHS